MSIKIIIPTPLRPSVNNQSELTLEFSGTILDLIHQLIETYPKLKAYMITNDGELRKFINFYINDTDIRDLDIEKSILKSGDILAIVPAIAGGRV